jgi:hypothetical protein
MKTKLTKHSDSEIRYLLFLNNTLQIEELSKVVCDEFTRKIFDYLEDEPRFDPHIFCALLYDLIFECKRMQPAVSRNPNPVDTIRFGHFQNDISRLFNSLSVKFTLDSVDPNQFRNVGIKEKLNHLLADDNSLGKVPPLKIMLPESSGSNRVVPFVILEFTLPTFTIEQKLDVLHFTICAINYLSQKDNSLTRFQNIESSQKPESLKIITDFLIGVRKSVIKLAFREKEVWEDESEFDESLPDIKRILQAQNQDPLIEKQWLDENSSVFVKSIAEKDFVSGRADAKKHKDLTIDRAILLMKHLAPRLTGCDQNKVADVIAFLTGFDSEAIRQGFSEIKNKFANKPKAYNKDVKIVCDYLNLIGLTNEAEKIKRDSGVT